MARQSHPARRVKARARQEKAKAGKNTGTCPSQSQALTTRHTDTVSTNQCLGNTPTRSPTPTRIQCLSQSLSQNPCPSLSPSINPSRCRCQCLYQSLSLILWTCLWTGRSSSLTLSLCFNLSPIQSSSLTTATRSKFTPVTRHRSALIKIQVRHLAQTAIP